MPNVSRAFGGPTESLVGYARAAGESDVDVHVAAPRVPEEDEGWLREELPAATFHFFRSAGRHAWVVSPGLWLWLARSSGHFDAVHVHGLFNPVSSLAARINVGQGLPTVIRPFGTLSRYTFSRRPTLKRIYFRLVDRPALRRAQAVHFTTDAEREEAQRLPLQLEGRSHVVPPPWRGSAAEPDEDARSDRPTVLFMSRLHPKKNLETLLEAWPRVMEELPRVELRIAGEGADDYVAELRRTVEARGLENSVSFLGFVSGEEKRQELRQAWAFTLPSHQENFGVAVLEALASGLPVVISGEVQLRSFVESRDLGVVVDRSEPVLLANSLISVLSDESYRRKVAGTGPRAVRETFSMDRIGQKLRQMYEKAIARSDGAAS